MRVRGWEGKPGEGSGTWGCFEGPGNRSWPSKQETCPRTALGTIRMVGGLLLWPQSQDRPPCHSSSWCAKNSLVATSTECQHPTHPCSKCPSRSPCISSHSPLCLHLLGLLLAWKCSNSTPTTTCPALALAREPDCLHHLLAKLHQDSSSLLPLFPHLPSTSTTVGVSPQCDPYTWKMPRSPDSTSLLQRRHQGYLFTPQIWVGLPLCAAIPGTISGVRDTLGRSLPSYS